MPKARHRRVEGWTIAARLRRLIYRFWAVLLMVCLSAVGSLLFVSGQLHQLILVQAPAVEANDRVLLDMIEAQSGLTGYELTGDRAMLREFVGARARTMVSLATVNKSRSGGDADTEESLRKAQQGAADQWWAYALTAEQVRAQGVRTDPAQDRALFERFRVANAAIGEHLRSQRNGSRERARTIATAGATVGLCLTFGALVVMLPLGRRVAGSISLPLIELRESMARQRSGEPGARAREDQGSQELRSLAEGFNALTEQNCALLETLARASALRELATGIDHSIRVAPDIEHTLALLCKALGEGLGVDRVIAHTLDANRMVLLSAQWHCEDLPPLAELSGDLLGHLFPLASELWTTTGVRARDDFHHPQMQSQERTRIYQRETGARAVIMSPIGLNDRVLGMIHVLMVREPRQWTESEANVVHQTAGSVAGAIVETEYRANQIEHVKRLERLDRHKTDFLATVSHELRTPLTSISGYLEMLQDGAVGFLTPEQDSMLEVMDRNANRLTSLIEDLLILNLIEVGDIEDTFVGLSMRDLITHAGNELSTLARKSAIRLDIEAGLESVTVHGDWRSLQRAVVNIGSNAIKFSHPGGVVTISCMLDHSRSRVLVSCEDQGIGIPADDQLQMFTRFYRAGNATERAIPGTGLGLSIVKKIVEDHGGSLRLKSVEGEGTTVTMDLPLAADGSRAGRGNASRSEGVFGIRV